MRHHAFRRPFYIFIICVLLPFSASSQIEEERDLKGSIDSITLLHAVICEDIEGSTPQNPTTVFSIERRKAVCFTLFDAVTEKAVIYHHWFHRDRSSAKIKLIINPPRWSTYSSIQFRAEDIGPWRVEITDSEGRIFKVLRFSITD